MCGINAIFNPKGIEQNHIDIVQKMNIEMIYRGPDSQNIWNNECLVFGQDRLSIIGVENGDQPIFTSDKSIVLICNGEIYNYIELKQELEEDGFRFQTNSDCEVIIHLYQKLGVECLKLLRGMFAFCLWDDIKKELFVARDRMGKKPLYFSHSTHGIVFSSEIKTITKHFLSAFSLNEQEVINSLKYSFPLDHIKTVVNEVEKVQPGEYIKIKGDKIERKKYWNIFNLKRGVFDETNYVEKTYSILKDSIDIRLRSDVPIALLLSSGIDSCSIAALAKKNRDEVHAITIGYKESGKNDEREFAKKFAKEKGLIYHELELDESDFYHYFDEYTAILDEPVCDMASIAQFAIYKKTKELGFKVLLSGIGGDELFYGYPWHNQYGTDWESFLQLKRFFPINSWKGLAAITKYIYDNKSNLNRYSKSSVEKHFAKSYLNEFNSFVKILPDDSPIKINNLQEFFYYDSTKNGVDNTYHFLLKEWLINNCFYLADKLAMGNSMEVRAPFADHKLIEYVMSIPFDVIFNIQNPKGFLKKVMEKDLPDYILQMPKKGFAPPLGYIEKITKSYNSKFFNSKLLNYNQVVTDKILSNYFT
jgi:asparagine synthase (glutamine-hydrolysing)